MSINDLTEQELAWYNKRVDFYKSCKVSAPTELLLWILEEGRKPNK